MNSNPKEGPNQEATHKGLPKGDSPPVIDEGGNSAGRQEKGPDNNSDGAKEPPTQNDNMSEPHGSNRENKWIKDDILKILPTDISFFSLIGTFWALNNTTTTVRITKQQLKESNGPYLEITNPMLAFIDSPYEMRVLYQIENLKSTPAQLISKAHYCFIDTVNNLNTDSLLKITKKEEDTTPK
jgi:hypothetical protein